MRKTSGYSLVFRIRTSRFPLGKSPLAVGFLEFSHDMERLRPERASNAMPVKGPANEAGLWHAERVCRRKRIGPVKVRSVLRICSRNSETFRRVFRGCPVSLTSPDCEFHTPPIG
jgi:hypothetical protein